MKNNIGIIGLGVMGSALARNFAGKKVSVSVLNRSREKTELFLKKFPSKYFQGFQSLKSFVQSLEKPRKIIAMISAGPAIDELMKELKEFIQKGDILIDGGNSFYKDTECREKELEKYGIAFLGIGISGGEKGALQGPSLMIGGKKEAWKKCEKLFEKIAAKDFQRNACVEYFGEGGSGHYVKMVHNGIEYALMQVISEAYDLLKNAHLNNREIAEIFEHWNRGKLGSFLIEMTAKVLKKKDDLAVGDLIEHIKDIAEQKGTGIWTVKEALERGIPINTIAEAVFARAISAKKELREKFSKKMLSQKIKKPMTKKTISKNQYRKHLKESLYVSFLSIFAQGFSLFEDLNQQEIARVWQGGCIIRTKLLETIKQAYKKKNIHLFQDPVIFQEVSKNLPSLREVVKQGIGQGIPITSLSSALGYIEMLSKKKLPTNLIQGLRDYFGAHGYERTDRKGVFHTQWE